MKKSVHKIVTSICIMVLIAILLTACNSAMTFDLKDITEIDLTSGSNGTIVYITNADQLEKLIQPFNDGKFLRGESAKNSTGWSYRLRFWQGDKMQGEIAVASDNVISYNNYFFQNEHGVIDLKYYEELLNYDADDRVALETDSGVKMIIESVTTNGLSFFFDNTTENEYTYGENYSLWVNSNHSWEPVPYIIENAAFHCIGYTMNPNSKTDLTSIDWTWLYGELPSGEYRLQKTILFIRSPGDFDEYVIEQDFFL